jgi:hypothetical protein
LKQPRLQVKPYFYSGDSEKKVKRYHISENAKSQNVGFGEKWESLFHEELVALQACLSTCGSYCQQADTYV